ncbi:MAG: hypothetical protein ACQERN_00560 [Thermodesulfobacteriota bacterium]
MTIIRDKFDFEIGHLTQSPCRRCPENRNLPECADRCRILDSIQMALAKGVSCTGRHPFLES